ncbi:MAG: 50S ribosomal protein L3 [Candidatus Lokiarchaeota archaeon]|nr:50S ribosomal protein L3 [Candidatus Lokiarchaeota archaeon]
MGHRKYNAPRHGSLSFIPRKRSRHKNGRIKTWPNYEGEPKLLGFAGYKAGMTHVIYVENMKTSPFVGLERSRPVTIIEVPPMVACAIKAYKKSYTGLITLGEAWASELTDDLKRLFPQSKEYDSDKAVVELEEKVKDADELRLSLHTQPRLTAVPKKKPDLMEVKIDGGKIENQFKFAKDLLGKEIKISDVFREADLIDTIAVSKGKGFQGVVRRMGIKILPRKSRKTVRGVGSIGPWKPARVSYTVPRSGQMGFHHRTEYNKRILKIGIDPNEIAIKGGIVNYGVIKGDYILLEGTVPGSNKRLIKIRHSIRPKKTIPKEVPELVHISLQSKQGK